MCCYVIFIKYVLVTFTNKQRRIIFKFDALYVEQLSPSSFIYISKPFSFFFFPAFASLLQSYCAVFCRICYIFSHLLYISAPIRTLSGEFEALHSPKRILTPLQQKFPQFTASKLVKFSTRSSTRKSPKICHAFFCSIVKGDFRVLIPLSSKRGPLQNLSYGKEFYLHGVYMIISRSKAPDTASV